MALLYYLSYVKDKRLFWLRNDCERIGAMGQDASMDREVSREFYHRVLTMIATLPHPIDFWSVRDFIVRAALEQMDTAEHDVMVMLALCTPPMEGQKVRSTHCTMCVGTPPPGSSLDVKAFLGSESLVGWIFMSGLPITIHDIGQATRLPLPRRSQHQSIISAPIRRGSRFAGTFSVASCTPNAFISSYALVEEYAQLLSLACVDTDFYEPTEIELGLMPSFAVQQPYLLSFAQRLQHVLRREEQRTQNLNLMQAEQLVWQQIEAELLQAALFV